ncbi:MAG: hypothetical protein ABWY64_06505, partial [Tardiphaga sp.]
MANAPLPEPLIYEQLSFLAYYLNCPCLDTEWLLSTLFDASLLSTSKPPETAALFWRHATVTSAGNHKIFFNFSKLDSPPSARNDLFIISRPQIQSGLRNKSREALTMSDRLHSEPALVQFSERLTNSAAFGT